MPYPPRELAASGVSAMTGAETLVFRGRPGLLLPAACFASAIVLAAIDDGRWGVHAAGSAAAIVLYGLLLRASLRRGRRVIRLEPDRLVLASGRGRIEVDWSNVGRVTSALPFEMGVEVLDLTDAVRFHAASTSGGPLPPELPGLEGGFLWIRGRFEIPLPDLAELMVHYQAEAERRNR